MVVPFPFSILNSFVLISLLISILRAKKDVLKLQEELDAKSSMFQHDR